MPILRFLCACFTIVGFSSFVAGQNINASSYAFTAQANATALSPTSFSTAIGSGIDDTPTGLLSFPAGFKFLFADTFYDGISISPDGWVRLGNAGSPQPINDLNSTLNYPIIAPYWYDHETLTGSVEFGVSGTAPNRIVLVDWQVYCAPTLGMIDIQLQLHETTGQIKFVYPTYIGVNVNNYSVGIGNLAGTSQSFASVTVASTFANSTVDYSTVNNGNIMDIANGTAKSITFTPQNIGAATSLNFSNIGAGCVDLTWTDNSVNETEFQLERSEDNVVFNTISTIPSTSINTVGTTYSYHDDLVVPSTQYYYRVSSKNSQITASPLNGNVTTTSGNLSGIFSIPGDYSSVTAAISDMHCEQFAGDVILELQSNYVDTVETFPILFSNLSTTANKTLTIRPALNADSIVITGTPSQQAITIQGVNYITFDGRPGGAGTDNELYLNSESLTTSTVWLRNDASYNTFKYCNFQSTITSPNWGAIYFAPDGNVTTGIDHNVIEYCNMYDGITTPRYMLYSFGGSTSNDSNVVRHNNFFNFRSTAHAAAIYVKGEAAFWDISDNQFFDTIQTPITDSYSCIFMSTGSGGGHMISSNYLGGDSAFASGNKLNFSGDDLRMIRVGAGTSDITKIDGNVIRNISVIGDEGTMIEVLGGAFEIGVNSPNIIGSDTEYGSIFAYFLGWSLHAIEAYNSKYARIENNIISGVHVVGYEFAGVYARTDSLLVISNNTIGSDTTPNSIDHEFSGTAYGIQVMVGNDGETHINNNRISGFQDDGTGSLVGIGNALNVQIDAFDAYIENNDIHSLIGANESYGVRWVHAPDRNNAIANNHIRNINCRESDAKVYGIYCQAWFGSQSQFLVESNNIHTLYQDTSNTLHDAQISGFYALDGTYNLTNNMIGIGTTSNGSDSLNNVDLYGIILEGGAELDATHNTVVLNGAYKSTTQNQLAMTFRTSDTHRDTIMNNIFVNEVVDPNSWSELYVLLHGGTFESALANGQDFNILYQSGDATIDQSIPNLATYQSTYGDELNSIDLSPNFVNSTGGLGTYDLHLIYPSPADGFGTNIPGILNDIDGDLRSLLSPIDAGADAGNYSAFTLDTILTGLEYCVGDTIKVAVAMNGMMNAGNYYTLELSDENGLWTAPDSIGAVYSNGTDTVCGVIPIGASTGVYKLRISSSDFQFTSAIPTDTIIVWGTPSNPAGVSLSPDTICFGDTTSILFSSTDSTHQWYLQACGGTHLYSGQFFQIPPPQYTTTYYVRRENNCAVSNCDSFVLFVDTSNVASSFGVSMSPDTICSGDPGGILCLAGDSYHSWYAGACGDSLLFSGAANVLTSPQTTTTYYFRREVGCAVSECDSLTIVVDTTTTAPPFSSGIDPDTICAGDPWNIQFLAGDTTHYWYANSCGDSLLFSGTSNSLPPPSSTTTYYIRTENECYASPCVAIELFVDPCASINAKQTTENEVLCYPSPAYSNESLIIENLQWIPTHITISDALGHSLEVAFERGYGDQLKISLPYNVSPGYYTLEITSSNRKYHTMILILNN